ncbi:MAG: hypothetical protein ACXWKQ_13160 [Reyranella sp.]
MAKELLSSHGGFLPFGGAMRSSGELVSVGTYAGEAPTQSTELIRLLKASFIDAARKGEFKATALVYDVRVALPSTRQKSDAVAVSLNHRDGYSVIAILPYKIDSGKLIIGSAFTQEGEADIFP